MALNVLHTTLLSFQQRSVWHWLLPFFIFKFFVFYLNTIVERCQEVLRTAQEVPRTAQEVPRIAQELPRAAQEVPRIAQEVPRIAQEVVGIIPTIQCNAKNILFYITSHLFNNYLILSK